MKLVIQISLIKGSQSGEMRKVCLIFFSHRWKFNFFAQWWKCEEKCGWGDEMKQNERMKSARLGGLVTWTWKFFLAMLEKFLEFFFYLRCLQSFNRVTPNWVLWLSNLGLMTTKGSFDFEWNFGEIFGRKVEWREIFNGIVALPSLIIDI